MSMNPIIFDLLMNNSTEIVPDMLSTGHSWSKTM